MQLQQYIFILLTISSVIFAWTEVEYIRAESIVHSSKVVNFNFRAGKINQTTYAVFGTIECLITPNEVDLYKAAVKVFYSSLGNNQFKLFPLKIEPLPVREILNGPYRKWFMNDLKPPASDIPYSTDSNVDLAELIVKPKNYTINNYVVSQKHIPKMLSNGLYKVLIEITQNRDVVAGYYALLSVY